MQNVNILEYTENDALSCLKKKWNGLFNPGSVIPNGVFSRDPSKIVRTRKQQMSSMFTSHVPEALGMS